MRIVSTWGFWQVDDRQTNFGRISTTVLIYEAGIIMYELPNGWRNPRT